MFFFVFSKHYTVTCQLKIITNKNESPYILKFSICFVFLGHLTCLISLSHLPPPKKMKFKYTYDFLGTNKQFIFKP